MTSLDKRADYSHLIGRDIQMLEQIPGHPPHTYRGPIRHIGELEPEIFSVITDWKAVGKAGITLTPWVLTTQPDNTNGEVFFYANIRTVSIDAYPDEIIEISGTFAGHATILPEGDKLERDRVKEPS